MPILVELAVFDTDLDECTVLTIYVIFLKAEKDVSPPAADFKQAYSFSSALFTARPCYHVLLSLSSGHDPHPHDDALSAC